MKRSNILWLALAVVAIGLGARQAYNLVEYPPTKSGLICVGDPKPFDCEFPPVAIATATIGPRPSSTHTSTHTSNTSTPTKTPGAPPTATAFPPLLVNGDFEQADHAGWTFVNLWRDIPVFNDERGDPRTRIDGAQSFRVWNNHRCVMAVLYQSLAATPLTTYDFSTWFRTWASEGVFPEGHDPNVYDGGAVGIDPNGGTNPTSSGVIWVEDFDTDEGARVTVRATALSSRITVFIRVRVGVVDPAGTACQWPHTHMMAFVDGATLAVAGAALQPETGPVADGAISVEQTATPTPATPPTEVTPDPYPVITRVAYP